MVIIRPYVLGDVTQALLPGKDAIQIPAGRASGRKALATDNGVPVTAQDVSGILFCHYCFSSHGMHQDATYRDTGLCLWGAVSMFPVYRSTVTKNVSSAREVQLQANQFMESGIIFFWCPGNDNISRLMLLFAKIVL
jgi:hypothetical protein